MEVVDFDEHIILKKVVLRFLIDIDETSTIRHTKDSEQKLKRDVVVYE